VPGVAALGTKAILSEVGLAGVMDEIFGAPGAVGVEGGGVTDVGTQVTVTLPLASTELVADEQVTPVMVSVAAAGPTINKPRAVNTPDTWLE
jgi:hypothetical protein